MKKSVSWVALAGGVIGMLAVALVPAGSRGTSRGLFQAPFVPAGFAAEAAQPPGGQAGYELVAPLVNVMEVMGDVFDRMPERVKAGSRRDFRALKGQSYFIAEIANLASRLKDRSSDKEWVGFATTMKTVAVSMAEAAGKPDAETFNKAYGQLKDSCSRCHEKFRD